MSVQPATLRDANAPLEAAGRLALGLRRVWERARRVAGKGRLAALLLLLGLVYARALDPTPLTTLRFEAFDLFQQLAPRPPLESRTAIVDIDDASIAELGQWPWSRDRLADLVLGLEKAGAASIGFDIVFSEADRLSPQAFAAGARGLPPMVRGLLSGLPGTDEAFAEAIRSAPVVLGMSGSVEVLSAPGAPVGQPSSPVVARTLVPYGADPRPHLYAFPGLLRNTAVLEQASDAVGLFNLAPEHDGVVRRVPAALRVGDQVLPTLSLEMIRRAAGAAQAGLLTRSDAAGVSAVRVAGKTASTDKNGRIWLRFAPHDPSLYSSAADVIAGRAAADRFQGKHVLVGTSAIGLRDYRMTPLGETLPGVEVHAQLIDAILREAPLRRPVEAVGLEHLAAVLGAALLILIVPARSVAQGAPIALGGIAALWAGAFVAFRDFDLALDPTYPSLAIALCYGALAYSAYARAEAQKRQIRSAFTQYLAPAMVERLADDPDSLRLGGESREMTFLFCDIAGFTGFVERAEPQQLVRLLNEYLEGVCSIVMKNGGAIDKIVGDAVHAMYNAPMDDADHAANAVRAALEIEAFVDDFRARKAAEGVDFGRTRIGVNTGPAVVGNFGGQSRFDYTAHGDAINTAARLESVNKHLGTTICVAGTTAALCPEIAFRPIGSLYLKGKDFGVEAFTPVLEDQIAAEPVRAYQAAFERLRAEAEPAETLRSVFDALAETHPSDPLIALHQRRLQTGESGVAIRLSEK